MKKKRNGLCWVDNSMSNFLLKMKLLTFLILVSVVSVTANSYSQETKFYMDFENTTVRQIFQEIEENSEFIFLYSEKSVDVNRKVNVQVKDETVSSILDQIFEGTSNYYEIHDRQIAIMSIENSELPSIYTEIVGSTQEREIRGIVRDSGGNLLPGVTVVIKGTTKGAITDIDGNFSLNDVPDDAILVFSFVGMKSQEIPVSGKSTIEVVLTEETVGIDEVVAIGYGTVRSGDLTGAVEKVRIGDVDKTGSLGTEDLLQGRASGVQISDVSGNPGGEQQINIRGVASIQGSTQPLIVIDGIPVSNIDPSNSQSIFGDVNNQSPLSLINPNDIESIEVLKDASAAAIYGSRANNGVIIITTKKGSGSKMSINFSSYTGIQDQPIEIETADIPLWLEIQNEARTNYNNDYDYQAGDQNYLAPIDNPWPGQKEVDWIGAITNRTSNISNVDVSISGESNKTKYFASFGYFSQGGWIITNKFKRYTAKLNIEHTQSEHFKFGVNFIGSNGINNRVASQEGGLRYLVRSMEQRPGDPIFLEDGSYNIGGSASLRRHNAYQNLVETSSEYKTYRSILNSYIEISPFKGFTYRPSVSVDFGLFWDYVYQNENSIRGRSVKGALLDGRNLSQNLLFENLFQYSHDFNELSFTSMFVHSFQKFRIDRSFVIGQGFPSPAYSTLASATILRSTWRSTTAELGNAVGKNTLESYVGRIILSYKNKYLLNAALRSDGSSKFADGQKFGYFPSASFAWKISQEPFFPESDILSQLKLRVSYGVTGSIDGVGDFASMALIAGGANYNNQSGIVATQPASPELTWEKATQADIGIDMYFFKRKVQLTLDYFNQKTNDLLFNKPIYSTTGFTEITQNVGDMKNQGFELSLNANIINHKDFSWDLNLNYTSVKNKITSLGDLTEIPYGLRNIIKVGKPIGSFYMVKQVGIYQNDTEVPQPLYNKGIRAGDIKYEILF